MNYSDSDISNYYIKIQRFFDKEIDISSIQSFLSEDEISLFLAKLKSHPQDSTYNVRMDDGYFYPFPYSTIHDKASFDNSHPYFTSSEDFENKHKRLIDLLQNKLEEALGVELFPIHYGNLEFSRFNCRILHAKKNGIDIHCENAFIPQLNPAMTEWMESIMDLKNALSFLLVLQAPNEHGELILFNKEWDDLPILIGHESYEDRHDIDGAMFKKRGVENITHQSFPPQNGEAIFFRAAQIWHGINKIGGAQPRITIGCFIAKGKDGKIYFWA
ncbi:MAG: hypothetical protein M9888_06200 [Chitinophagales bacterium]|nr:hypothetical protein [Chitinophagales bacterium]